MMNPMVKSNFSGGGMSPAQGGTVGPPLTIMDPRPPVTPMSMNQQQPPPQTPQQSGALVPVNQQQQQQQQQQQPPGGSISLGLLIDFIVQRTYHELSVLAEL